MLQGWYYAKKKENLTGQRHDRVQTEAKNCNRGQPLVTLANGQGFGFEFHLRSSPSAFSGFVNISQLGEYFTTKLWSVFQLQNIYAIFSQAWFALQALRSADEASDGTSNIVAPLPFKDQKSANSVKREMQNLSAKIGVQIKPVFQSKKISQVLSPKEKKSPIVNNQCVVYKFQCDLCDTDYVGYTTRHLH